MALLESRRPRAGPPQAQPVGVSQLLVVVVDEGIQLLRELLSALETGPSQELADQRREPHLDGIKPAGMHGRKEEDDGLFFSLQPRAALLEGVELLGARLRQAAQRGGITKTGNAHLRRVLVESAWHSRHPSKVSAQLRKRRAGKDPVVVVIASKAHRRLHQTYRLLTEAGKPVPRAVVAVGRELLGFMWAIERQAQGPGAAATEPPAVRAPRNC